MKPLPGKAGLGVYYQGKLVARCFRKHDFYRFLDEEGVEWESKVSTKLLPDDALLVIVRKTLFIIEVKYQQVAGSVDEKLQTCDFKKKQYVKLVEDIGLLVEYVYVLSDWFKASRYEDVLAYVRSVGCHCVLVICRLRGLGCRSRRTTGTSRTRFVSSHKSCVTGVWGFRLNEAVGR